MTGRCGENKAAPPMILYRNFAADKLGNTLDGRRGLFRAARKDRWRTQSCRGRASSGSMIGMPSRIG